MTKAAASEADALILDLEDAVAPDAKSAARAAVADFLRTPRDKPIFVRINAQHSPFVDQDLACLADCPPDGVVVPKATGPSSLTWLDRNLPAEVKVLPIAIETPQAVFGVAGYDGSNARLCGLTWGAEDLAAGVGASKWRLQDGCFSAPFELARALTLFAAHAAGVPAIETVYPDFRDRAGLAQFAARARGDGFGGMLAIHPDQVSPINDAFTPSPEELAHAQSIVEAFRENPGVGAVNVAGRMVDAPHLRQAMRVLSMVVHGDQ
jgi:citrate lyase subunit beta/citryl-CoA lyase